MKRTLLIAFITVFVLFIVLPIGVGAITHTEELDGLLETQGNMLAALQQTLNEILNAYKTYLESLVP